MDSLAGRGTADGTAPPRPHVVLVASPGAGHLIPMAELARRLVRHHGVAATVVTFTDLSAPDAHSAVLSSLLDAGVDTAALPAVPLDDLPVDANISTLLLELMGRSIPHLRTLLRDISSAAPLAALVPDFFGSKVLPLAAELGLPAYLFFPVNNTTISLMRNAVEVNDGAASGEYRDLPFFDTLQLPGAVSLRREDYPDGFRNSKEPVYAHLIEEGRRYRTAAGFLVNTFAEIEPGYAENLRKQAVDQGTFPPAYLVGPLVRPSFDEDGSSACLDWLDQQPAGSVVYVSFGSAGSLSVEQTAELAAGLEDSGHRFIWVVRMPSLDGENSDWGKSHRRAEDDPLAWLPEGFLERTSGRGLAMAAWAPQVRVLSHPATAAFVSHGGWNSTLESVAAGVPMVVWPLYAEQKVNAVVLSENVGLALRPRATRADGLIAREEIAAAVRELMGGEEKGRAVRRRAEELQRAAALACAPGGSSWQMLEEVAGTWKAVALARQLQK
jgi:hydroquinone glucosyltransferase